MPTMAHIWLPLYLIDYGFLGWIETSASGCLDDKGPYGHVQIAVNLYVWVLKWAVSLRFNYQLITGDACKAKLANTPD
jgi:hypothetical protein